MGNRLDWMKAAAVILSLCLMMLMTLACVQASIIICHGDECGLYDENDNEGVMVYINTRRKMTESRTVQHISYGALAADNVPCPITGQSYYYCNTSDPNVNPYTRACTAITRCERDTN
jgi:hypothetical protein